MGLTLLLSLQKVLIFVACSLEEYSTNIIDDNQLWVDFKTPGGSFENIHEKAVYHKIRLLRIDLAQESADEKPKNKYLPTNLSENDARRLSNCSMANCISCSKDLTKCLECANRYKLYNGKCLQKEYSPKPSSDISRITVILIIAGPASFVLFSGLW